MNVVDRSNLINHRYGVLVTADIDNDVVYIHIFDGVKTNQIIFYRETPDDTEFCSSTIEYLKKVLSAFTVRAIEAAKCCNSKFTAMMRNALKATYTTNKKAKLVLTFVKVSVSHTSYFDFAINEILCRAFPGNIDPTTRSILSGVLRASTPKQLLGLSIDDDIAEEFETMRMIHRYADVSFGNTFIDLNKETVTFTKNSNIRELDLPREEISALLDKGIDTLGKADPKYLKEFEFTRFLR